MLYTIDTAAAIRKLEKAGCDGKVANAIVETISTVHGEVATKKADLEHLEHALTTRFEASIAKLQSSTQSDIGRLEASMKSDIGHLEASMKSDVERLETSISTLETSTKTAIALSESRVTSKLWWAIGLLVAILKALDYLLPALGG